MQKEVVVVGGGIVGLFALIIYVKKDTGLSF